MAKELTLEQRAKDVLGDLLDLMRDIDAARSKRAPAKDDGPEAPKGSDEREEAPRARRGAAKADKAEKKADKPATDPADMTVKEFRRYVLDRLHNAVDSFESKPDTDYDAFIDKYIQPVLDDDKVNAASDLSEDGIEDLSKALDKFEAASSKKDEEEDRPRRRGAAKDEEEDRPRRRGAAKDEEEDRPRRRGAAKDEEEDRPRRRRS